MAQPKLTRLNVFIEFAQIWELEFWTQSHVGLSLYNFGSAQSVAIICRPKLKMGATTYGTLAKDPNNILSNVEVFVKKAVVEYLTAALKVLRLKPFTH